MFSMGLDFVAAALASKAAEGAIKIAREGQRAAKKEQVAEQRAQAASMHEKASKTRWQAVVTGSTSIAGGAMSMGAAGAQGPKTEASVSQQRWAHLGTTTSACAQPAGNLTFGGGVIDADADATTHGANAKTAEGVAEDYGSFERQARSIVEKAASVLQSLVQERQAITRAILRAGG